jgi:hypothetical protein
MRLPSNLESVWPFTLLLVSVAASTGLAASMSGAGANDSDSQCQGLDKKIVALIDQYKELRERRRHLPDGAYDKDLRDHGGKLHRVLESLGTELGHSPYTKKIIVGCLGEPDAIWNDARMAPFLGIYERDRKTSETEPRARRNREYLIYHWRGGHDFLFFIDEAGLIVDHGWWFAYE